MFVEKVALDIATVVPIAEVLRYQFQFQDFFGLNKDMQITDFFIFSILISFLNLTNLHQK